MQEIEIPQFRFERRGQKKSSWMGQNGSPIWLEAQKAIVGFQFIAYFGIPNTSNGNTSNGNQNHGQICVRGHSQTTLTRRGV